MCVCVHGNTQRSTSTVVSRELTILFFETDSLEPCTHKVGKEGCRGCPRDTPVSIPPQDRDLFFSMNHHTASFKK